GGAGRVRLGAGAVVAAGADVLRPLLPGRADLHTHSGRGGPALGLRAGHDAPPDDCRDARNRRARYAEPGRADAVPVDGPGLSPDDDAAATGSDEAGGRGADAAEAGVRRDAAGGGRRGSGLLDRAAGLLLSLRRGVGARG